MPDSPIHKGGDSRKGLVHLNMDDNEVEDDTQKRKTLILIRHAQSEENVKVIDLIEGLQRLRQFRCPTCKCFANSCSLLQLTIDSLVSTHGENQIMDMHRILSDNEFWKNTKVDLVVCSPLTRAKETCEGVLPHDRSGLTVRILDDLEEGVSSRVS